MVAAARYVPSRGHIVWISFDPQRGHEQAGRRPALVLSPSVYNARSGLMIASPIASQSKGYPFEVPVPPGLPISGVALVDQMRSLDWVARSAEFCCAVPELAIGEALAKAQALLS